MKNTAISIGDDVRHKTKYVNGNVPMSAIDIQNNHVLCQYFEPNEEGGTTHTKTWFPIEELEKVVYGDSLD